MLRTLSLSEKYKTNIDDVEGKRRYSRNILQWSKNEWSKNDFKSKNSTNGDYSPIQPFVHICLVSFETVNLKMKNEQNISLVMAYPKKKLSCNGILVNLDMSTIIHLIARE